jgi:hypothetical protein
MDYGVEKKVINESTRINLLGNVLVLIAAKDSKIDHVDIEPGFDLAKLAGDGRIATGDVEAVPVGLYAKRFCDLPRPNRYSRVTASRCWQSPHPEPAGERRLRALTSAFDPKRK